MTETPLRLLCSTALLLGASATYAQLTGGPYVLTRSTIDNGGSRSAGAEFILTGTIGQPEASLASAGGEFLLTGGFWAIGEATPASDPLFSDGFEDL